MPYLRRGGGGYDRAFDRGMRIGEHRRRVAQQEREERRFQEELARAQEQEAAAREAVDFRLGDMEDAEVERLGDAPGPAQLAGGAGVSAAVPNQGDMARQRFDRIRRIAARMSPEGAERFAAQEAAKMRQDAMQRASQRVMDNVQDRRSAGGYNLYGDSEVSEEIDNRLQQLVEGMQDGRIGPEEGMAIEQQIAESVMRTNQERLKRERGKKIVEAELGKAVQGGQAAQAESLEMLHALWSSGEMDYDDLEDRLFEIRTGRKTARAAGPTPYDVRQKAISLWNRAHEGEIPTERDLREMEELVNPAPPPAPKDAAYRQREAEEREVLRSRIQAQQIEPSRGDWKNLPAKQQDGLLDVIEQTPGHGEEVARAVFEANGIDPNTLSEEAAKRLILIAEKKAAQSREVHVPSSYTIR